MIVAEECVVLCQPRTLQYVEFNVKQDLYSYGLHSYGLYSYGLFSHGLYTYGLRSYGLVMA